MPPFLSRLGWIRRRRHVGIDEPFVRAIPRRVAISICRISRRALLRTFFTLRRLGILPDRGKRKSTLRRRRRAARKSASGRRRARIVEHPIDNFTRTSVVLNILRRCNARAVSFIHRNCRAVDSRPKTSPLHALEPIPQVLMHDGGQSSTFFQINENDRPFGKTFLRGGSCRRLRIQRSFLPGICRTLQRATLSPIEKHHKSKSSLRKQRALS